MKYVLILLALLGGVQLSPIKPEASTCGYDSCPVPKEGMINVHMVCHTHDDVGWLKTIDEYYYGDHYTGVQYILDTVVSELQKNPERRFIYVESSFFWRWWKNRGDDIHQQVQALVQSGQLEFINGAWTMSDEAGNYYSELIDAHTTGFRFLNDTFGPCAAPKIGWQIDPFGHSRETASLFAQFNYDGFFIGRLDFQDKTNRQNTKTMEFLWDGSANIAEDADIFLGVLPNRYSSPSGFCFDIGCQDTPIKDDPNLKDYNVDQRVDDFISLVNAQAANYATPNIIMTFGDDFQYADAATWFVNLDKLAKYVNQRQETGSNINVFYSTPSCYLKALHDADLTWTTKTDDFFPYGSDDHAYWTGLYTSRVGFKGYTKFGNNILQIGKQVSVLANKGAENDADLDWHRHYQGDAQHHDAITGTAKQAVNDDYTQSLSTGISYSQQSITNSYEALFPKDASVVPTQEFCHYLNVSYCDTTEKEDAFSVTVYNVLGQAYTTHIRVPVTGTTYSVTDPEGNAVESQLVPLPDQVLDDPEKLGEATNDLVFQVNLQPSGFNTYFVEKSDAAKAKTSKVSKTVSAPQADVTIQNELVSVTVTDGLLASVTDLTTQKTYSISQQFLYYPGMAGDNHDSDSRASGAYIFRPNGTTAFSVGATNTATVVTGDIVQEIHQTFSDYVSQVIRLYPGESSVELEWFVGPIPVDNGIGKEVIARYTTDLASNSLFFTDANGREVLQRQRDYRPTWDLDLQEPISGNYYPVNSRIFLQDAAQDSQVTIVNDRSQGGSSITDGAFELMVHRRLLYDDAFGVGEALDEPGVDGKGLRSRGKHQLIVSSLAAAPPLHRVVAQRASHPPYPSFAPLPSTADDFRIHFNTEYSGLTAAIPDNVKLLTLEPWSDGTVLLRLEHFFEATDDPEGLSLPVTVNIQNLFSGFEVTQATETTLGANVWLADKNRFSWNTDAENSKTQAKVKAPEAAFDVTLNPMEIRTFVLNVAYN